MWALHHFFLNSLFDVQEHRNNQEAGRLQGPLDLWKWAKGVCWPPEEQTWSCPTEDRPSKSKSCPTFSVYGGSPPAMPPGRGCPKHTCVEGILRQHLILEQTIFAASDSFIIRGAIFATPSYLSLFLDISRSCKRAVGNFSAPSRWSIWHILNKGKLAGSDASRKWRQSDVIFPGFDKK